MTSEYNSQQKTGRKIAEKHREPYSSVITYITTKLIFALLRSTLAGIWGLKQTK